MKKIKLISLLIIIIICQNATSQGVAVTSTTGPTSTNVSTGTTVSSDITSIGNGAGTGGGQNSAFGNNAGSANTNNFNCFFGYNAGTLTTTGNNSFFGHLAGASATTGGANSFFGKSAGASVTTGSNNTYFGQVAGASNVSGHENVMVGDEAGGNAVSGSDNSFIGFRSGLTNSKGSNNSLLGAYSDVRSGGLMNATAIGAGAIVGSDNSVVLGRSGPNYDNIGIGISSPLNQLHVVINSGSYFQLDGIGSPSSTPYQMLVLDANDYVSVVPAAPFGAENGVSIDANNNVALGQDLGATGAPSQLLNNREIPLNGYDIYFTDNITTNGNIGLGITSPLAKLHVYRQAIGDQASPTGLGVENHDISSTGAGATGIGVIVDNGGNANNTGLFMNISNGTGTNTGTYIGVTSPSPGSGSGTIGLDATVSGGNTNSAIKADASAFNTSTSSYGLNTFAAELKAFDGTFQNIGILLSAGSSNVTSSNTGIESNVGGGDNNLGGWFNAGSGITANMGVLGEATNGITATGGSFSATSGTTNIGVYGYASGGTSNTAGFFDGDVFTTGHYLPSDESLKSNIKDFNNSLELLNQLIPKTYDFKVEEYRNTMNLPEGNQIGIMAKNLQNVFPNLVKQKIAPSHRDPKTKKPLGEDTKFLAVNYVGLVPVLVQGVKELTAELTDVKTEVAELKAQNVALQSQLNDICSNGCTGLKSVNSTVDPVNKLLQNVPNPFTQQTTIGYVLNSGNEAYLNINSLDGKLIKHVDLSVKGAGVVTIGSNEMAPGTYTYSLYIDSQVLDTKIMVITAKD